MISSSARIIHIKLHNLPALIGPSCFGFKKEIERDKGKSASHVLEVSFYPPLIPLKNAYLLSCTFCNLLAVLRVDNVGLLFSILRGTIFLISSCCFHYMTYCGLVFTTGFLSRMPGLLSSLFCIFLCPWRAGK